MIIELNSQVPKVKCKWLTCKHNSKNQKYVNGLYPIGDFGECRYEGEIELESVECECQEEMEDRLECLRYERRV